MKILREVSLLSMCNNFFSKIIPYLLKYFSIFLIWNVLLLIDYIVNKINPLFAIIFYSLRLIFCSHQVSFYTVLHTGCVTKIRTNWTISLNKIFLMKKLIITKNPFTWHLGDSCRAQLFSIYSLSAWMTTSILSLKRSHARCNEALPQSKRSLITSHWEICLWSLQLLRSIRSSPRDLNLGCWEARMGAAASNSTCPGSLRASVVSLMCMICIEGPCRHFDALLARLH